MKSCPQVFFRLVAKERGGELGVRQSAEHMWLVSFMDYDLRYFDDETCRLEPIEDPFGSRLSPMSPE